MSVFNTTKYLLASAMLMSFVHINCLANDEQQGAKTDNWMQHGRSHKEQRFSPLEQINSSNVSGLGVEWSVHIPSDGLAATPIVIDGVIYMTSSFARVWAINAETGEQMWMFDPQAGVHNSFANSYSARINKGVAVSKGKVYVGSPDCRLIAINADTGKQIWEKLTCDPSAEYAITGAPRVANGKVFIGNGVSDYGARGYVSAYAGDTGKLLWRFYTVPGNPDNPHENEILKMAAGTWADGWAKNGGGSAWDAIVYDAELNQLYIGTDSALPWDVSVRSPGEGDNLFTNSIIALDADTGKYIWHYQTVPADAWDLNAANHMILADLDVSGKKEKVLMQAPKNGFFYLLERRTGKLLSAEKYVKVTWASHIDMKTGRPIENQSVRYYKNKSNSAEVTPTIFGGHGWESMSYSPDTGLVYIPAHEFTSTYTSDPNAPVGGVVFNYYGEDLNEQKTGLSEATKKRKIGKLIAWDPIKASPVWKVESELPLNGGVLSTAGNLVFQGSADGHFMAYEADSGQLLWKLKTGSATQASPVSYMLGDKQYVLIPVGASGISRFMVPLYGTADDAKGPSRLIAFTLNGKQSLPEVSTSTMSVPEPPKQTGSKEMIAEGEQLYEVAACGVCHGSTAVGQRSISSSIPDLRYMRKNQHTNFKDTVIKGYRRQMGMLPFDQIINNEQVEAIHAFLIDRQSRLYEAEQQGK
jgi:quinohemoprotein ethanol dehydrogenase